MLEINMSGDIDRIIEELVEASKISDSLREYATERLAMYFEEFVPMRTGQLANSVSTDATGVSYDCEYAEDVYSGINPKTGAPYNFRTDLHPLAQAHWDEGAMDEYYNDFCDDVQMKWLEEFGEMT